MIYIQKIQVNWTKKSRGNPGARLRNQLPEKIPFAQRPLAEGIWLQETVFQEQQAFKNPRVKVARSLNSTQLRAERLFLQEQEEKLQLAYWVGREKRKKIGALPENTWGQVQIQWRLPLEHTWGYTKLILNVFYGVPERLENVFNTQQEAFCEVLTPDWNFES